MPQDLVGNGEDFLYMHGPGTRRNYPLPMQPCFHTHPMTNRPSPWARSWHIVM